MNVSGRVGYGGQYPVDSIEDKREDVSWMAKLRSASSKCVVISEILDSRTKHLINITKISDYVMSNELVRATPPWLGMLWESVRCFVPGSGKTRLIDSNPMCAYAAVVEMLSA